MKPIKWIKAGLKRAEEAGAKSEEDTERDGAFSWSGETHGFAYGVYYGFKDFRDWDGMPEEYGEGHNVEKGHYPKFGYVVGAVLRVACYVILTVMGYTMLV